MKRTLIALNLLLATLVLAPCSFAVEGPHAATPPGPALATTIPAGAIVQPMQAVSQAAAPEVVRQLPAFLLDATAASCLPCGETLSDCHQFCVDFGCFRSIYHCACSGESTCSCDNCVG